MRVVGEKRKKALTKDTSNCLSHTCNGLVEISQYLLLQNAYQCVMLGIFTTDPLEKEFSKLRQGSGGTYFITTQQVLEKVNISKTRFLLKLSNISAVDLSQMERGHCCSKFAFVLDERMCEIIDCLPQMQPSVSVGSMMGLVYIAGVATWRIERTSYFSTNYCIFSYVTIFR